MDRLKVSHGEVLHSAEGVHADYVKHLYNCKVCFISHNISFGRLHGSRIGPNRNEDNISPWKNKRKDFYRSIQEVRSRGFLKNL